MLIKNYECETCHAVFESETTDDGRTAVTVTVNRDETQDFDVCRVCAALMQTAGDLPQDVEVQRDLNDQ
jgi:hypothetical protein